MKKTAEVMYRVAKIIAIIIIPVYAVIAGIYLTLGIVHLIQEDKAASGEIGQFVNFLILSILAIVALIVSLVEFKRMKDNPDDKFPHIVCIVMGVLGSNPFFIVGAILNIIMICQREDEAKPAEEKKEEVEAKPEEEKGE